VIETARALLEERGDDHDLVLLRQLLERRRARARNRLRQPEIRVILALAEVLRSAAVSGVHAAQLVHAQQALPVAGVAPV
jgi:hypothetical protein